jgi:hypothetical protein
MLSVAELIATSRTLSDLNDFGEPDVEAPLQVLVDSLNSEANLSES